MPHRPGNAIDWIFSAVGLLGATGRLAQEYAAYANVTRPGQHGVVPVGGAVTIVFVEERGQEGVAYTVTVAETASHCQV